MHAKDYPELLQKTPNKDKALAIDARGQELVSLENKTSTNLISWHLLYVI
jgi:hypothetical protein